LQPVLLTMHVASALEHELAVEPLDVAPLAASEPPALPELPEPLLPLALPLPPAPLAPLPLAVPLLDPAPPGAPALAPVPVALLVTVPEAPVPPVLAPAVAAPLPPLPELAGLPEPPEPPDALDAPGACEQSASVKTPIERSEIGPDIRRPVCARCIAAPPRAIVPLLGPEEHRVSV
jgi:hypothetical protein